MIHDAEKNTWSVVLPLPPGQGQGEPFMPVRLVVVGAARSSCGRCLSGRLRGRGRSAARSVSPVPRGATALSEDDARFAVDRALAALDRPSAAGVPPADVTTRVLEMCGGITLVAVLAFGLGFWVSFQVSQFGYAPPRVRRRYAPGRPAAHGALARGLRLDHSLGRLVQAGAHELGPAGSRSGRRPRGFPAVSAHSASGLVGVVLRRACPPDRGWERARRRVLGVTWCCERASRWD